MSTTTRDIARRCNRCERVVLGTQATVAGRLCTRCRSEFADLIRAFMAAGS